jgi:hypothetical protein
MLMNSHRGFSLRLAACATGMILLVGCGAKDNPPEEVQSPSHEWHLVQVEVYSADIGPVADARTWVWYVDPLTGYTFTAVDDDFQPWPRSTDTNGQIRVGILAPAGVATEFSMLVDKPGFVQPCAVRAEVPATLALQVEMMATWVLDQFDPPRLQSGADPWLTGTIFEMTASGRQPIPAAQLRAANRSELNVHGVDLATTESDLGGGFFLCNLGPAVHLHVSKPGFRDRWVGPFDATETGQLDIELERM